MASDAKASPETMAKKTMMPTTFSPCAPLKAQGLIEQTPQSQASTAPSTPFSQGLMTPPVLPNDFRSFMRQATPEHAAADFEEDFRIESATSQDEASDTESSTRAEEGSADEAVCREIVVDDFAQVTCFGTPQLKSELGRWAQAVVQAQEWLEEKQSLEYIIQAPVAIQASSPGGIAFRRSRRFDDRDTSMEGPSWGSKVFGIDLGDGWLKVPTENRFLPMFLRGQIVVKLIDADRSHGEALVDGPALTPDGKAVDLDGGVAIFFSSEKALAPSSSIGEHLKENTRMRRAVQVAHAACDAEALVSSEEACSVDEFGIIRGELPTEFTSGTHRLKRYFRRRQLRGGHWRPPVEQPILCVDGRGQVSIYLNLRDGRATRATRLRDLRRRAGVKQTGVMAISVDGVIRDSSDIDA